MIVPRLFLRQARRGLWREKIADSSGASLTGGTFLLRTLILRRLLLRDVFAEDEQFVGLLLPPSVGGVVANVATTLARRVVINLNYTLSTEALNHCVRAAGLRHILTSRRFMERFNFKLDAELVFLEDFKDRVSMLDKLVAGFQAYAMPLALLDRQLGLTQLTGDDLLTVIFTSGSTGMPKGVMLTFDNIGHNREAIQRIVRLTKRDVVCGILPLFHALGFTVTLWSVITLEPKTVYHYNPLEAKAVGKLCREHGVTVMLATPTFLRNYLRRCEKEDFASLDVVVTGAEKLPRDLCDAFQQKFGIRPIEGYGATELSPLVSVNVPPNRAIDQATSGLREGTVGRPVPHVAAKVIDPETQQDLSAGQAGLLLVKGPNVMKGYLNQPEATAKVLRDGWYVTGDMAMIDDDGFIHITGRQSRFSKIAGEMVPHGPIEEILQRTLSKDEDRVAVAVAGVPDERRGERIVVLYTHTDKTPQQMSDALTAAGLPHLWIPAADSFFQVEELPLLGTGKLDLQAVNKLAFERAAAVSKTSQ